MTSLALLGPSVSQAERLSLALVFSSLRKYSTSRPRRREVFGECGSLVQRVTLECMPPRNWSVPDSNFLWSSYVDMAILVVWTLFLEALQQPQLCSAYFSTRRVPPGDY
jgi:hypothetical protein